MRRALLGLAACAGLWLAPGAFADDSEAELAIGGLRFARTDAIQMLSEDLYLSMDQVRIRYVFHNRTRRDVTTLVAFPLPDIAPDYYYEPVAIPDSGDPNFVRFQTRVDGRPIAMLVDQRARLHGADVTARVRAAGLPLSPIDPHFDAAAAAMNAATRNALLRAHLIEDLNGGDKNQAPQYRALWSLSTTYSRMQTFPAGRDITVEQLYAPIVGGSVESLLLIGSIPRTDANRRALVAQYCVDEAFERAAQRTAERYGGAERVQERRLAYVLRTGANWAGPILRFHLTVDKGAPQNLVSLCAPDIRPTSDTRFELNRSNYTPREDLHILFLTPQRGEQR